jgi:hypothetical protein
MTMVVVMGGSGNE